MQNTNTSTLNVSELDFDNIKQELINYLSSQSEFSEYNFEGAALNVLMDMLAYVTHMNSYMANMLANEMFLDSASLRESVVSKAKEIGFTPRSCRSAKADVTVEINNVGGMPPFIKMESGTSFDSPSKFKFATSKEYLLYPKSTDPTTYTVSDVDLYDGDYVEFHYTVNDNDPDQLFFIPSVHADISTLRVFVQDNKNSTSIEEYFLSDDLNRLTPNSKVFFLYEHASGQYVVSFGDGILGHKVINGNYITLSYIVSAGREEANNESEFIPIEDISGFGDINVITNNVSMGGAEKESIKDIKFLAPKMYQSQRRAVTVQDYETFLLHDYPWIDTINTWGGEDNKPPIYGKVFFAIKPKHTEFLSPKLKEQIKKDVIKKYNVVTVIPEILDPDYIYIDIDALVYYRKNRTINDESFILQEVVSSIYQYFEDTTKKFKMDFKFSPMMTKIDESDQSIDSSLAEIKMHKRIYPIVGSKQTFNIDFNNRIKEGSVISSAFNVEDVVLTGVTYKTYIKDDGNGIINLIKSTDTSDDIYVRNIGTVDYENGVITMTILPYGIPTDTLDIRIYTTPYHKNITSGYNQIIMPDIASRNEDSMRIQGVSVKMINIDQ